ncbi:MAG: hypothetical protein AAB426_14425, partial [Myxococcota bacterium]
DELALPTFELIDLDRVAPGRKRRDAPAASRDAEPQMQRKRRRRRRRGSGEPGGMSVQTKAAAPTQAAAKPSLLKRLSSLFSRGKKSAP